MNNAYQEKLIKPVSHGKDAEMRLLIALNTKGIHTYCKCFS
jgi:hypothetical protein